MKRLRDEAYVSPQFKRPFGPSRGESYGLPHAPVGGGGVSMVVGGSGTTGVGSTTTIASGSAQKLTTNDALTYLKEVKDMFQDQREKYDRFLDVMKDFKAQRIDTAGVIARVKDLFKGHPNLILGFNTFLPKGYEITLTDEEEAPPKRTVEFEEAISFVNKIKKRFQNDDHVYKSFLDILNMYRKEHKGITEVYEEVATLFSDQPDLLDEFTRFLPDSSATSSAPHPFSRPFHRYDERSSVIPTMRNSHMEKQRPRRDQIITPHSERDLSVEHPDVDDEKTVVKMQKDHKKHSDKEHRDKKNRDQNDRDPENENNGDISMRRLSDKRKSSGKVGDLGKNSNIPAYVDKDALKSMYSQEFTFCEKVKERLGSEEDYQAFLKCLHIYSREIITRKELQSLVSDLLGKYPDLMEGFYDFLEHCERIDGFLAGVMGRKVLWNDGTSKASRIEDKDKELRRDVEGVKEKDRYNLKYWGKSIQELDLSDCRSCSPSYRLLPDDYPIPSASQRSELGAQVLNDHWVSVTSGSEDYSFKHMRRNQYEESLFRCEDDRFELDMLLESVCSTETCAEELLNCINNNLIGSDSPIQIEDHFTALNLRCIERLYGDHGLDVIDILRKNPSHSLPVILTRLKQKQEEWTKCRSDFNNVWAEIYSKNHYKSLDHRSFYFKQQDSKILSTKSLLSEIKEVKEKRQKEDDVILSIAAGNRHSTVPDLELEYLDAEVHKDVYKIIKYSCEEVCSSKEQLNKVLRFWTTFLEPMLGVHSHSLGSEFVDDDCVSKHQAMKNSQSNVIESKGNPNAEGTSTILKQLKPNINGSPTSPSRVNFSRDGFSNVDSQSKERLPVVLCARSINSDVYVAFGSDANQGRSTNSLEATNDPLEEGSESKPIAAVPCQTGETLRLNQIVNGELAESSQHAVYSDDFVDPCKNEKEEGELSPNGDSEENFGVYRDRNSQDLPGKIGSSDRTRGQMDNHEEICPEVAGENDVDADDEESENISEAEDNVSGSESPADECSRDDHEEEDDGEHDDIDVKVESEGEAENTSDGHYIGGDGAFVSQSEHFLRLSKPVSKHVCSSVGDGKNDPHVFYGNDTFYVLLRLHETLYERILSAKVNSLSGESKMKMTIDASSDPYSRFMSALFRLLDGSSDNTKFEDDCRSLIGNKSYVLFTLDKLIYKLVKQLQTVSSDEMDSKLLQLYDYEKSRKPEKFVDSVYYENVRILLHDENIYRLECVSPPTRLCIQLMDDRNEKSEVVAVSVDPNFASYLRDDYLSVDHGVKEASTIMLKRNMRKYAHVDVSTARFLVMENILIMNGLECKMAASSSKISYVLDTEDYFIRLKRRRGGVIPCQRVQRFHQFLAASI